MTYTGCLRIARFETNFAFLNCCGNWTIYVKSGISYLRELGWKLISTYEIVGLHASL